MSNVVQGSPSWFAQRQGLVTASRLSDVMAKETTASRNNYMAQLIAEVLTGETEESYTNDFMQWGIEKEGEARTAYEFVKNTRVEEIGFAMHPKLASGASPDGLVGNDGLVEIKCPKTKPHIDYLLTETIPKKYKYQMLWQMECTSRNWCDFVSYDPRLDTARQLFVKRYELDAKELDKIREKVTEFIDEMADKIKLLKEKYGE